MLALYTNLSVRLRRDEKGATAVEYGIMVALIAVVIIVAVTLLGTGMQDTFTQVQCSINGGKFTAATTSGRPPNRVNCRVIWFWRTSREDEAAALRDATPVR